MVMVFSKKISKYWVIKVDIKKDYILMHNYNKKFFDYIDNQSFESAEIILKEIYKNINFQSIVDVGCGTGSWLRAASSITKNLNYWY